MKAIVIGASPAIQQYKQLEILANSNFNGSLFICDTILKRCLEAGITPDKFKNYFVISLEFGNPIINSFLDIDVTKYKNKITVVLFLNEYDKWLDWLKSHGFIVEFRITPKETKILSNCGCVAWKLATENHDEIALIGMELGYDLEFFSKLPKHYDKVFKKIHNTELNCDFYLDGQYNYVYETFLEALKKTQVKTINCTEKGSLEGPIKNMEFKEWILKVC